MSFIKKEGRNFTVNFVGLLAKNTIAEQAISIM